MGELSGEKFTAVNAAWPVGIAARAGWSEPVKRWTQQALSDGAPARVPTLALRWLTPKILANSQPTETKNCFLPERRRSSLLRAGMQAGSLRYFTPDRSGTQTKNVVPAPSWLSTHTRPPCSCAMCFTIDRPSPVPPVSRERPLSTR